jgi:hypothetical protein
MFHMPFRGGFVQSICAKNTSNTGGIEAFIRFMRRLRGVMANFYRKIIWNLIEKRSGFTSGTTVIHRGGQKAFFNDQDSYPSVTSRSS